MITKDKKAGSAPLTPEEEQQRRKKRRMRKKIATVFDRIFGFLLVTIIVAGVSGLALEYVLVKGPSPQLKETFVMTMLETRRFRFIPNIFLTEAEMTEMTALREQDTSIQFDSSLVNIPSKTQDEEGGEAQPEQESQFPEDEDGDGIIFSEVKGSGFVGYSLTILDPTRVFVGKPENYGGVGDTLDVMADRYDAIGGINAGGFYDPGGSGLGGQPDGLTIVDGVCYNEGYGAYPIAGFDENGIMYVGYYTYEDALNIGIVDCVSFGPLLIMNGQPMDVSASGLNPRTAIGQRSDGAVVMLVIDGRSASSIGAKYQDVVDILLGMGVVNAINLDGGSSTVMYYNGEYVNNCSSENGLCRPLATTFLFK